MAKLLVCLLTPVTFKFPSFFYFKSSLVPLAGTNF